MVMHLNTFTLPVDNSKISQSAEVRRSNCLRQSETFSDYFYMAVLLIQ